MADIQRAGPGVNQNQTRQPCRQEQRGAEWGRARFVRNHQDFSKLATRRGVEFRGTDLDHPEIDGQYVAKTLAEVVFDARPLAIPHLLKLRQIGVASEQESTEHKPTASCEHGEAIIPELIPLRVSLSNNVAEIEPD